MNIQKSVKWYGMVILALGVLGFIPGIVSGTGLLFGIFLVSILANIIHIAGGLVGIESAMSVGAAKLYFKIMGVIFLIVAILGFANLTLTANLATNILHVVLALVALYFGFIPAEEKAPVAVL
ncbi:MAG: DUF4383 domain-containing protein [Candidatus Paceibacterota bacterium]